MKFSMHNWMRPEPIETTLERLHRFGYDGIEISGEPAKYNTDEVRALPRNANGKLLRRELTEAARRYHAQQAARH